QTVANLTYGNLIFSGSGTKTCTGFTVNGDFTQNGSAAFGAGTSQTYNFYGNFTNNSTTGTPYAYTTGSVVNFNTPASPAPTTIGGSPSFSTLFGSVNFN